MQYSRVISLKESGFITKFAINFKLQLFNRQKLKVNYLAFNRFHSHNHKLSNLLKQEKDFKYSSTWIFLEMDQFAKFCLEFQWKKLVIF